MADTLTIPSYDISVPATQFVVPAKSITLPAPSVTAAVAALVAAGYIVTPPGTAPTQPTLPQSGPGVVYNGAFKGAELWPGDWSGGGVQENYNAKVGSSVCLSIKALSAYPLWLPYPPLQADGYPSFDTTPYTHFVMIAKLSASTDQPTIGSYSYQVDGNGKVTGDISNGPGAVLSQFITVPADADGFVTYTVPLSAMQCLGMKNLYKIISQDSACPVGSTWYIKYAAFV